MLGAGRFVGFWGRSAVGPAAVGAKHIEWYRYGVGCDNFVYWEGDNCG